MSKIKSIKLLLHESELHETKSEKIYFRCTPTLSEYLKSIVYERNFSSMSQMILNAVLTDIINYVKKTTRRQNDDK